MFLNQSVNFVNTSIKSSIKRRQRDVETLLPISSGNSRVMPSVYDLLKYVHFKILGLVCLMLFSDYLPIASFTWRLCAVLSFYMVNNDPIYYYLCIPLFFFLRLPSLLEHLGIPVTVYVSQTLEKITQLFIFLSFLDLRPTPGENRLAQRQLELQAAEQRVIQGNLRVSALVRPLGSFFKTGPKPDFKQQQDQANPIIMLNK